VIASCARMLRLRFVLIASVIAALDGGCRSAAPTDAPDLNVRTAPPAPTESLPQPGTMTASLPPGGGMDVVRSRCVACHEPSMLRQQRLTAQQWVAEIEKMQGWGAQVSTDDKTQMASYLATIAGRDNTRFSPMIVAPVSAEPSTRNVTGER
jgi:mono/diheme cytochrome c family protein